MDQDQKEILIIPDTAILQVLTYLEMQPIHSLCELIDNSIDSMSALQQDHNALIIVDLPTRSDIDEGHAIVRVRDNGPGMTIDQLTNSLKAGYSSKARHGQLGLFGVGFNIATGKLGRVTKVITARKDDDFAIESEIDLVNLRRINEFKVKAVRRPKPVGLNHGTVIEISEPWGPGTQNHGYMQKLVSIGRPKIIAQLGRIYASLLRPIEAVELKKRPLRILVGEHTVEPFYHCAWSAARSVETQKHGQVSAVFRFANHVIHTYSSCADCGAIIPPGESVCAEIDCKSSSLVTREERLTGWVGIQRYSDSSHYGIDLIRNGRAIKILAKEPFFEFVDPGSGEVIVDYPTDQRDGRIIGEVHLDHVPVDPTKQNFEQSSPEWRRAIEFLRGQSSLQPMQPNADRNTSPIFRLYQAYRKIRRAGRRTLTMGKWLPGSSEPTVLSKADVDELKKKFDLRELGYFDDVEWYRLVEIADQKPLPGIRQCPTCFLDGPSEASECSNCGHIFQGKTCLMSDCGKTISSAATTCPHCGGNQVPHFESPWTCNVCITVNSGETTECLSCHKVRGAVDPVSLEGLLAQSQRSDEMSIDGLSVKLASEEMSSPIDLSVYLSQIPIISHRKNGSTVRLPSVRFTQDSMKVFVDPKHTLFDQGGISIHFQVAFEVAFHLTQYYAAQYARFPAEHSLTKLTYEILSKYWPESFSTSTAVSELQTLFSSVRNRLADSIGSDGEQTYNDLGEEQKTMLASELVRRGRDLSELSELKRNGQFVHFMKPKGILEVFRLQPKLFFDGKVWSTTYAQIPSIYPEGGDLLQNQVRTIYGSLLEIAAVYAEKGVDNRQESELVSAACKLLLVKLGN